MKYQIKYSCGCEKEIQLFGKEADRKNKIDYLEAQTCFDCKRKKELIESKIISEENGLPILIGTEKQVAWAEKNQSRCLLSARTNQRATKRSNRISRVAI